MSMSQEPNNFRPLFDGLPVVLRLMSHEEILAIVYYSDDDDRFMLERPLLVSYETTETINEIEQKTSLTRIRTRFERWITLSDAIYFPVYLDHVLTVAPLAEPVMNTYIEWADRLYTSSGNLNIREIKSSGPFTNFVPGDSDNIKTPEKEVEEIRESYFDFILHNFNPKGKPN